MRCLWRFPANKAPAPLSVIVFLATPTQPRRKSYEELHVREMNFTRTVAFCRRERRLAVSSLSRVKMRTETRK
jgi:hypothetical protein